MLEPISGQMYRPRPMYNAVNIEIHVPQNNMTSPMDFPSPPPKYKQNEGEYACPRCGYYDVPTLSVYKPNYEEKIEAKDKEKNNDKVLIIPQQTIIKHRENNVKPVENQEKPKVETVKSVTNPIETVKPKTIEIVKPDAKILQDNKVEIKQQAEKVAEKKTEEVAPKKIEVVKPNDLKPVIDINTLIAEIASPDFARQADAMETISKVSAVSPEIGAHILDTRVIDTLLGVMMRDTSNLSSPTQQQLMYREAILRGHELSPQQTALAQTKAPVELAEENKAYAMYTIASMQKVYSNEVEKMGDKVVPLKELPGAKEIIKEVETNTNPHVRVAGLNALNYVQRPEYNAELQAIYQKASQDENPIVKATAQKAMSLLG